MKNFFVHLCIFSGGALFGIFFLALVISGKRFDKEVMDLGYEDDYESPYGSEDDQEWASGDESE